MNIQKPLLTSISLLLLLPVALFSACSDGSHHEEGHSGAEMESHGTHAAGFDGPVPENVLIPYMQIQESLAGDSMEGVQGHAASLHERASIPGAREMADSEDIETAREHFETVSDYLIAAAREHGTEGETVRLAHCPMAFGYEGGDWLQTGEVLANPYYGATMLRCGTFQDL